MALKKHGITTETVSNMVLGAGVIYKNLAYASSEWTGEVIGATSGGITFHHEINWLEIEVDGATVLVKGVSRQKVGEAAYLEGQLTEVTPFALTKAMHLVEDTESSVTGYTKYVSQSSGALEDDYIDNVAYVGTLSDGRNVIIILPNAVCLEAVELNPKNASQMTYAVRFECTADLANDTLDKLDIEFYYPEAATTGATTTH